MSDLERGSSNFVHRRCDVSVCPVAPRRSGSTKRIQIASRSSVGKLQKRHLVDAGIMLEAFARSDDAPSLRAVSERAPMLDDVGFERSSVESLADRTEPPRNIEARRHPTVWKMPSMLVSSGHFRRASTDTFSK